ncbi:type I 3-dehydroquinate dehydratase [Mesoterricola silvestris]|uniref:Shikimate dehydrogenase (NADP(+)) n=1 Tax=Mesoterricola silvestris TaxID=2927979 RepID=A0AA48GP48_9BACT|nr:type I 3-dehydroquinate dehydratase [Mesoterricola silvestris]BDU73514.1 shikimate dehydrogenase (NADP(+)) [Mesoterricola silvestris]
MPLPPPYFVTLAHSDWKDAEACARGLPDEALAEVRLDLFPDVPAADLVRSLRRKCLVTCRRREDGGAWEGDEASRIARLVEAAASRPAWLDLEWELPIPPPLAEARSHLRLLRSVHVGEGVFDLDARLAHLPEGDAYKWVGRAGRLADNAKVKAGLAWARDRGVLLSAFLMGARGIPSRCMQFAWGGAFTYAAADDAPAAAPGQVPLSRMLAWRCHRLHAAHALCGVLGSPVLHSRGPAYHNPRFQAAFKDLLYLPLECAGADEALEALEALPLLGASLTAPLKETLPPLLGLPAPLNTLHRRGPGLPWEAANTDAGALDAALEGLARGPVLLLGDGGVAATTLAVLQRRGWPVLQASRRRPVAEGEVEAFAPVGIVQATALGMAPGDPAPFPRLLEAAGPGAKWAVEWIYKEDTAFAAWAREAGLRLVEGAALFEGQARAQSELFIRGCGGG